MYKLLATLMIALPLAAGTAFAQDKKAEPKKDAPKAEAKKDDMKKDAPKAEAKK